MNDLALILMFLLCGLYNMFMSILNLYIWIKEGGVLNIIAGVFAGCGFLLILILGIEYILEERKENEEWNKIKKQ